MSYHDMVRHDRTIDMEVVWAITHRSTERELRAHAAAGAEIDERLVAHVRRQQFRIVHGIARDHRARLLAERDNAHKPLRQRLIASMQLRLDIAERAIPVDAGLVAEIKGLIAQAEAAAMREAV